MKEEDIRIREVYNKYIHIVQEDIEKLLDIPSFKHIKCPACKKSKYDYVFTKAGFQYVICNPCGTLFANPRPSMEGLSIFYSNSKSSSFWSKEFFPPVAEARREKIFKPRAEFVKNYFLDLSQHVVGDIGAGFGIFLEEMRKIWPKGKYIAIEPCLEQADLCRKKGLSVKVCMLENLDEFDEYFDLLFAFELFEHVLEPYLFLRSVLKKLKSGGYFVMTTLNGQGFDIVTLWDKSKSIFPPHHLNFFNVDSISLLFKECGFNVIDVSTPGELDWDIVEGMYKEENISIPRFMQILADKGTDKTKEEFQRWISNNNLSSHMRIIARKPG
jgi:SAM-dependent methyltransferase/ribosomal protein S27E